MMLKMPHLTALARLCRLKQIVLKKSICIILVQLILVVPAVTNAQYNVSGRVSDSSNRPIDLATVLLKTDTIVLTTILTDKAGNYLLPNLKTGDYSLSITYLNYLQKKINFTLRADTIIDVVMAVGKDLGGVTVVSKRPIIERKIDRIVFNVENSITAVGADALDAIDKTPGVRVQDNAISIIGKGSMQVMVNDRIVPLSGDALVAFLKSIPSEQIARIEVITNPPAKYAADGNSGLINIVKKVTKQLGYNGIFNAGFSQATYPTINGGIVLNYNKNKTQVFGSLNALAGATSPTDDNTISYANQTWEQQYYRKNFSKFIRGSIGVETVLSPKSTVGLSYTGFLSEPDTRENNSVVITNKLAVVDSSMLVNADNDVEYTTHLVNAFWKYKLKKPGHLITVDADWFKNDFDQGRVFNSYHFYANGQPTSYVPTQFLSGNDKSTQVQSININVDMPFKGNNFFFGGKATFIKNQSDISLYQFINNRYEIDYNNSNQFSFDENTQALFSGFSGKKKKWEYQLGLRAEYTQTKGNSPAMMQVNRNDYFNLFPTFYILNKLNPKNTLSLNYGKRISRPSFALFNPFRSYANTFAYTEGNPFLEPSYIHNIELSHTYNNFITFTLSYSRSVNQYRTIILVDNASNTQISRPENFLSSNQYLFNTNVSLNKVKWLQNFNDFSLYYSNSSSKSNATEPEVSGWGANFTTKNTILLNKTRTVSAGIDFTYQFPEVSGISTFKAYSSLDLALKLLCLKKKLQITVNGRDVFRSRTVVITQVINNISQVNTLNNDSRRLLISIRYSFGNNKVKAGQTRSSSQVEQGRSL